MRSAESHTIASFKKGDEKAFEIVFKLYYKQLCYFAEKLIGSQEDARDIVSEVFVKLYDRRAHFDQLSSVKAFLYIATRNASFDYLKSVRRVTTFKKDYAYWADHQEEVLGLMYNAELARELDKEIELLPKKVKGIVKLIYIDGLTYEEIAQKLNIPIRRVWYYKNTAVKLMKAEFLKRKLISLVFTCLFLHINKF